MAACVCFSLFRTELRNSTDDFDDLARLQRIGLDVRLQPRRHELDPTGTDGRLQRVTEMQRDAVRLHDGSAETRARVRPALRAALDADGEAGALAAACDDIGALARHCRFSDCRHQGEPGCAVRDAVGSERLRNFHKLRRESAPGGAERRRPPSGSSRPARPDLLESERDRLSALERRAQVQQWEIRARAARERARDKR